MSKKIEVKAIYSGWQEVDEEQAKRFVKFLLENIPAIKKEEKVAYAQSRLRGITVEELLK